MAGLVPAIHVLLNGKGKTWMPGMKLGMTNLESWIMRANDGTRTGGEILIDQLVVHGVQHVFYPPDTLKDWPKGADGRPDKRSRFVFITKDLERVTIERHLKPFIGEATA